MFCNDANYFIRVFKKYVCMTPKQYRDTVREQVQNSRFMLLLAVGTTKNAVQAESLP